MTSILGALAVHWIMVDTFVLQCHSTNYVSDNRRGVCWKELRNGVCEEELNMSTLKSECCSSIGKAWGSPCEPCPVSGIGGKYI